MALRTIRVTPTITAGAYGAGDAVGQRMSISLPFGSIGKTGYLRALSVFDLGNIKANLVLHLFRDTFTGAADNAAIAATDAELAAKGIGLINVATTDYVSSGTTFATAIKPNLDIPITFPRNKSTLYFQAMAVATPTYTLTNGLTFVFAFEPIA